MICGFTTLETRLIPRLDCFMKPLLSFALCQLITFGADKPNMIFIMADDLGYGDLGC